MVVLKIHRDQIKEAIRAELRRQQSETYDAMGHWVDWFDNDDPDDWIIDGHVDPNALAMAVLRSIEEGSKT